METKTVPVTVPPAAARRRVARPQVPDVRTVTGVSGKATLKNFKTMLAEAKLPERTVEICLRGDLVAEHQQAERELERAKKADRQQPRRQRLRRDRRTHPGPRSRDAGESLHVPAARDARPAFRAFKAEHPIRIEDGEPNKQDAVFGFNTETGFEPLTRHVRRRPGARRRDLDAAAGHAHREPVRGPGRLRLVPQPRGRGHPFLVSRIELMQASAAE
jgi:hypothetical protein